QNSAASQSWAEPSRRQSDRSAAPIQAPVPGAKTVVRDRGLELFAKPPARLSPAAGTETGGKETAQNKHGPSLTQRQPSKQKKSISPPWNRTGRGIPIPRGSDSEAATIRAALKFCAPASRLNFRKIAARPRSPRWLA